MSDITGRSLPFKLKMQMRQIALPRFAALNRRRKKKSQFIQLQIKNRMLHSLELKLKAREEELAAERERADRMEAERDRWRETTRQAIEEGGRLMAELAALRADAARDVLTERRRQVEAEGWTPEHDDEHGNGEMAEAAACYAACAETHSMTGHPPMSWPWSPHWWKPSPDQRRNLVKAAALLLAEIERLDRTAINAARQVRG